MRRRCRLQRALSDLAAILEAEGLRTNVTRKLPEQRVGANRLSTILRNDYYLGIVRYGGKTYPGRHEPELRSAAPPADG